MENKLKLSDKLSFRGWPPELVYELRKLEIDNDELVKQNEDLKDALRRCVRENIISRREKASPTKTDSGSPRNDPQSPRKTTRIK